MEDDEFESERMLVKFDPQDIEGELRFLRLLAESCKRAGGVFTEAGKKRLSDLEKQSEENATVRRLLSF